MITKKQMNQIKEFALDFYKKQDPFHNVDHGLRAMKLAELLAKKEKIDINFAKVAGLLHQFHDTDIDVEGFLKRIGIDKKTIEKLLHCIEACSIDLSTYTSSVEARTKEAKIIYDADRLQSIGPYGFCRLLSMLVLEKKKLREAIRIVKKIQNYEYNRLYTKTARKLAKNSHKLTMKFFKVLKEWDNMKGEL